MLRRSIRVSSVDPDPEMIFVRRGVVPYELLARDLRLGKWPTIDGVSRQTAHKAAKILSRTLRTEVRQAVYSHGMDGKPTYMFFKVAKKR